MGRKEGKSHGTGMLIDGEGGEGGVLGEERKRRRKWTKEEKVKREAAVGAWMERRFDSNPDWTPVRMARTARHYLKMEPVMIPWLVIIAQRVKARVRMRRIRANGGGQVQPAGLYRQKRWTKARVQAFLAKLQSELIRLRAIPDNRAALAETRAMTLAMKAGLPVPGMDEEWGRGSGRPA